MVALVCLLYAVSPMLPGPSTQPFDAFVFHVGDWMLAVAALLTLWSGLAYLRAAWPALVADRMP
jgi:CDP-diacylglycerol--glycerol-3-phosphate 3-phosphatidyltransferase